MNDLSKYNCQDFDKNMNSKKLNSVKTAYFLP